MALATQLLEECEKFQGLFFFYLTRAGLIAYPAPFIIQFKFKQLVLGLQVKLAAEEDRASGLAGCASA